MFDILIRNGIVIDGGKREPFRGDVGIKGDRIKSIGDLQNERSDVEIDAQGRIVCPGFVDVNDHSDTYWRLFSDPDLRSLVFQGVTTIVGGNCGSSLAPLVSARNIETIQKWIDLKKTNVDWLSTEEFFRALAKTGLTLNFATLAGHGTLRRGILGDDNRSLTAKEIRFMHKMLKGALKDGALGMSSGLVYTHAKGASVEELIALAGIVEDFGGIYAAHMRSEREGLLDAVEEILLVARNSGVRTHISHLKAMGEGNWDKMDKALEILDDAREKGTEVTFDVYPYVNTGSVLYTFLPDWLTEGGRRSMLHRLKDDRIREKALFEMKKDPFDFGKIEVAISALDRTLPRRRISQIAASQGKTDEEAVLDMLIASEGRVITSVELLSEENIRKALAHPMSMVATNGSGYSLEHARTGEMVHPRNFGAFPKVLEKYVREEHLLDWEDAIRKMTSMPAERFGIRKRGRIKEGYFADVIVINQARIKGPATAENPYQYAEGIDLSMVNGEIILNDGVFAGGRHGRVLKR